MNLKHFKILLLLICMVVVCSCGSKRSHSSYEIGIDPSWYPLQIPGMEKNVLAFSIELLVEIAKKEKLELAIASKNWNNLVQGLEEKKYDAILASIPLYNFNLKQYSFSSPYLMTGPILVTRENSSIQTIDQLQGKVVGVVAGSSAALLLQSAPGVMLRNFDSIAATLVELADQQIEAAAVMLLVAQDYVRNLYSGTLKLVGEPLNEEGLRLTTLHNNHPELIRKFNHGLVALKKNGDYEKLLQKWGLSPDGKSIANVDLELQKLLAY